MNNSTYDDVNACGSNGITGIPVAFVYVEVVIYPILLLLCSVGNVAIITVLTREWHLRPSTTHVYLLTIAVTDVITLWQYSPMYVLIIVGDLNPESIVGGSFYDFITVYAGISAWAGRVLMSISEWILVIFSVERLVAILLPLSVRTHVTPLLAIKVVVVCSALCLISATEDLAEYFYSYSSVASDEASHAGFITVPHWLEEWKVLQTAFGITTMLLRFLLLSVANVTLAVFLTLRQRKQSQRSASPMEFLTTKPTSSGSKETKHANLLLFASFALYFSTRLPALVFDMLNLAASPPFCTYYFESDSKVVLTGVSNLLLLSNCSLTIVFFGAVSRKFRRPFFCLRGNGSFKAFVSGTDSTKIPSS